MKKHRLPFSVFPSNFLLRRVWISLAACGLFGAVCVLAQSPIQGSFHHLASAGAVADVQQVTEEGLPMQQISVKTAGASDTSVMFGCGNMQAIKAGDVVAIKCSARAPFKQTAIGRLLLFGKGPSDLISSKSLSLNQEWQSVFLSVEAPRDFGANEMNVGFAVGSRKQGVQIQGFEWMNLGSAKSKNSGTVATSSSVKPKAVTGRPVAPVNTGIVKTTSSGAATSSNGGFSVRTGNTVAESSGDVVATTPMPPKTLRVIPPSFTRTTPLATPTVSAPVPKRNASGLIPPPTRSIGASSGTGFATAGSLRMAKTFPVEPAPAKTTRSVGGSSSAGGLAGSSSDGWRTVGSSSASSSVPSTLDSGPPIARTYPAPAPTGSTLSGSTLSGSTLSGSALSGSSTPPPRSIGAVSSPRVIPASSFPQAGSSSTSTLAPKPAPIRSAGWRGEAKERIDKIRKNDLKIIVKDSKGKVVPGASVKAKLNRHAFTFGTAVNKRYILDPDNELNGEAYRNVVKLFFNQATLENGLKWGQWEHPTYPFKDETVAAHQWLRDQDMDVRGTALVWGSWDRQNPRGLEKLNPQQLRSRIQKHITDIAGTFKGEIVQWDVVNEPRTSKDFQAKLGDKDGSTNAIASWFKLANQADPKAKLYVNEFGILNGPDSNVDSLLTLVDSLRKARAPIHGIGLQGHFDDRLPDPERMLKVLDRLAKTGLDIQITEFDLAIKDEARQADFTRDFYTAMFSHPSVNGITSWGFWEGNHWQPESAYFRKDWTYKPNGVALATLLTREWMTEEQGFTDESGTMDMRGFHGSYEVIASHNGERVAKIIELRKGASQTETIVLPSSSDFAAVPPAAGTNPTAAAPAAPVIPNTIVSPSTPIRSTPSVIIPPATVRTTPPRTPSVIIPPSTTVPATPTRTPSVIVSSPFTPALAPGSLAVPPNRLPMARTEPLPGSSFPTTTTVPATTSRPVNSSTFSQPKGGIVSGARPLDSKLQELPVAKTVPAGVTPHDARPRSVLRRSQPRTLNVRPKNGADGKPPLLQTVPAGVTPYNARPRSVIRRGSTGSSSDSFRTVGDTTSISGGSSTLSSGAPVIRTVPVQPRSTQSTIIRRSSGGTTSGSSSIGSGVRTMGSSSSISPTPSTRPSTIGSSSSILGTAKFSSAGSGATTFPQSSTATTIPRSVIPPAASAQGIDPTRSSLEELRNSLRSSQGGAILSAP